MKAVSRKDLRDFTDVIRAASKSKILIGRGNAIENTELWQLFSIIYIYSINCISFCSASVLREGQKRAQKKLLTSRSLRQLKSHNEAGRIFFGTAY